MSKPTSLQTVKSKSFSGFGKSVSVLDLRAEEARSFFLKPESFCTIELPPYFSFEPLINEVKNFIDKKQLGMDILGKNGKKPPSDHEKVCYSLISNKDGRYAWRPLQIIHPVLYVLLVNEITKDDKWTEIRKRFTIFAANPKIQCLSIPVQSSTKQKDGAAQISHWWMEIEQATFTASLDFEYVFKTDIVDCYGAIYTHSIAWALHGRPTAKAMRKDKKLIGNIVDKIIREMRNGQTNGIPQGSVLMDFIAEMVLGYADEQLTEELKNAHIDKDYKILRYRDDYRIFVNEISVGENILRKLNEILIVLGLKINTAKTTGACPVVEVALKKDKLAWIQSVRSGGNLQKDLLLIHAHSLKFTNAGSLVKPLVTFFKRLHKKSKGKNIPTESLIGIIVDIAARNPRCFPHCAAILSELLRFVPEKERKREILGKVHKKLSFLSNNGHQEVWLQRISLPHNIKIEYKELLCKLDEKISSRMWNNDWIFDKELRRKISDTPIIDQEKMDNLPPVIKSNEIDLFDKYSR